MSLNYYNPLSHLKSYDVQVPYNHTEGQSFQNDYLSQNHEINSTGDENF